MPEASVVNCGCCNSLVRVCHVSSSRNTVNNYSNDPSIKKGTLVSGAHLVMWQAPSKSKLLDLSNLMLIVLRTEASSHL